ncbi:hypothetical protein M404DRAFT_35459 [Pisolithus tinctorius Marx 270]|uniref:Uncharacterized protein n=1 Tax=Pisolithus tinctorius Marx 270 TaxID=870435 RepID=A0A0C3J8J3_PISTI|nr:hypothetical protein M404DRAFT_35459 [Pisolithus tinctorius Marx 270]
MLPLCCPPSPSISISLSPPLSPVLCATSSSFLSQPIVSAVISILGASLLTVVCSYRM